MFNSVLEYLKDSYEAYPNMSAIVYDGQSVSYRDFFIAACIIAKWIKKD